MKWFFTIIYSPLLVLYIFANPGKKHIILEDLYARKNFRNRGSAALLDLAQELSSPYFRMLFYFRTNNMGAKILRILYGGEKTFILDINTKIGAGLKLAHPYSTILNAESIGEYVYVNHLVTVGEINGKKPVIGNFVELHANATVIGGVKIGEHAVIGAGAVVVKDVPAGAVAVGNPARIILKTAQC